MTISSFEVNNIDKELPSLRLFPYTKIPDQAVDIIVTATDNVGIAEKKYAKGVQSISYFHSNGIPILSHRFTVAENGTYTVYVKDLAGNEVIKTINITEIGNTDEEPNIPDNPDIPENPNKPIEINYPPLDYSERNVERKIILAEGCFRKVCCFLS